MAEEKTKTGCAETILGILWTFTVWPIWCYLVWTVLTTIQVEQQVWIVFWVWVVLVSLLRFCGIGLASLKAVAEL